MGMTVSADILDCMEESTSYNGIISIFTTNQIESIDKAVKRPGRISSIYTLDYPSIETKKKILKLHMRYYKFNISYDELYKKLAYIIKKDITGAVIANILLSIKQHAIS